MKKRISLLLAIVMLFSSFGVYAASMPKYYSSDVEYMFYDADDQAYGVFGQYTNGSTGSISYNAEDAGIYVGSQKFSYFEQFPEPSIPGKFGFALLASEKLSENLLVKPYATFANGEKVGFEKEYDFETNSLKEASSNNKLASLTFNRKDTSKTNMGAVYMFPAFDPDVTSYMLYGNFRHNTNQPLGGLEVRATSQDPNADVVIEKTWNESDGAIAATHTATITVTPADGSEAKVYTVTVQGRNFTYKADPAAQATASVYMKTSPVYYQVNLDGTLSQATTFNSATAYAVVRDLRDPEGYADYMTYGLERYAVFTFDITQQMKDAIDDDQEFAFTLETILGSAGVKNLTIEAKAVNADGTLGESASKIVLANAADYGTAYNGGILVTKIIKDTLEANPDATQFKVGIQITDFDVPSNATSNVIYLRFDRADKTSSDYAPAVIGVKAD